MNIKIKDPFSALSHLVGVILSVFGTVLLVYYAYIANTIGNVIAFLIYGISLIALYTASTVYHWVPLNDEKGLILRKLDHMMIFVLIAGTYTPICLVALRGVCGWVLFSLVWIIAIAGIIMKAFAMDIPRWIYTGIYIAMGWLAIFVFYPLSKALPIAGIIWLVLGGVFYTVGGVIYALKWPKINSKWFGFHELFHLFILAGSACHYWLIFNYLLNIQ